MPTKARALTRRSSTSSMFTPYFPSTGCSASRMRLVDFAVMRMVLLREEISRLQSGRRGCLQASTDRQGQSQGVQDCLGGWVWGTVRGHM